MPGELLELQPPVALAWWWWLVVAGLVLMAAALGFLTFRLWPTTRTVAAPDDSLAEVRSQALEAISSALEAPAPHLACQRVVAAVKGFIGTVTDGDTDYSSLAQLNWAARRDPRLERVAAFVAGTQAACFDPAVSPDAESVAEQGREVILTWR